MGTRSNTYVIETGHEKEFPLVNIYRQFDGYPSCHGKEIADFIAKVKMVNGIGFGTEPQTVANGAGCFAAQLIVALKKGAGGIYLDNPQSIKNDNNYTYEVRIDTFEPSKGIRIKVRRGNAEIFDGRPAAFAEFCKDSKE